MTQVAPVETATIEAPPVTMRSMKLLKHYQPAEILDPTDPQTDPNKKRRLPPNYEIVGWHRPEKKTKDSHGVETIVQTAAFIEGEAAPPPFPGVGFTHKIWAGTVVKLPLDEAKRLQTLKLAERDIDD